MINYNPHSSHAQGVLFEKKPSGIGFSLKGGNKSKKRVTATVALLW